MRTNVDLSRLFADQGVEDAVTLADRIVMHPKSGRVSDEFVNPLTRPRDRLSPAFEAAKLEVLRASTVRCATSPGISRMRPRARGCACEDAGLRCFAMACCPTSFYQPSSTE